MKSIDEYINEKLILNKNIKKQYKYFPKDTTELKDIIYKLIDEQSNEDIINLNYIDTSKITDMVQLFRGLDNIIKIDVSNWDTYNVNDFSMMFTECSNLEEIIGLENFNTSNVTDMSFMFDNCKKLLRIDISNWDVSKVKDIQHMFECCFNLETIGDVSHFKFENMIKDNAYHTFASCKKLKCDIRLWADYFDIENTVFKCPYIKY